MPATARRGGEPYALETLLGLLLYSYATGVFGSRKIESRKIERATHESAHFRYDSTDPGSRIMKYIPNQGIGQDYNAQVAVDQESLLIVSESLSNHPNDRTKQSPRWGSYRPSLARRWWPCWTGVPGVQSEEAA